MDERFGKQLAFIVEVDKMKTVIRRTLLTNKSRRENDAEHSWHLALAAMLLLEHAENPERIDLFRVLKMALVHDLVEIYAGDTFAYDAKGNMDKAEREDASADKLFSILPEEQGHELRALWEEFDAMDTPDSLYAAAIDRLQPFILNSVTDGHTWFEGRVTRGQVLVRMDVVRRAMPSLWGYITGVIDDAVGRGIISC